MQVVANPYLQCRPYPIQTVNCYLGRRGLIPSFPLKAANNMTKEALICQIIEIQKTNRQFIQLSDVSSFDHLPLKNFIS